MGVPGRHIRAHDQQPPHHPWQPQFAGQDEGRDPQFVADVGAQAAGQRCEGLLLVEVFQVLEERFLRDARKGGVVGVEGVWGGGGVQIKGPGGLGQWEQCRGSLSDSGGGGGRFWPSWVWPT